VVSFLLVAASVYFLVIVPIDAATAEGSRLLRKVLADRAHGGMEDVISSLDDSEKEILANLVRKLGHTAEDRAVGEKKTNPPT
jgi:hypothetical protein